MKNYKNFLTLVLILITCLTAGCKTKKVESVSVNTHQSVQTSNTQEKEVFINPDQMAEFPGGVDAMLQFVGASVRYPAEAAKNGIEGRVVCSFTINEDGGISDIIPVRPIDRLLDEEAMRVIKSMPKWKPAKKDGKIVRMRYTLPIVFRLPDGR